MIVYSVNVSKWNTIMCKYNVLPANHSTVSDSMNNMCTVIANYVSHNDMGFKIEMTIVLTD